MLGLEAPTTVAGLLNLVESWGVWAYLGLALLVAVEGPLVTLLAAVGAAAGALDPLGVFTAAALGNLTADGLWYTLGYSGQMEWLRRHGHWAGLKLEHLERFERLAQDHAPRLLFISKLTLGLMIPALVATGLVRLPWRRWLPALALAETLWTGTLVALGYFFGSALGQLEWGLQVLTLAGGLGFVMLLLWYWTRHRPALE